MVFTDLRAEIIIIFVSASVPALAELPSTQIQPTARVGSIFDSSRASAATLSTARQLQKGNFGEAFLI